MLTGATGAPILALSDPAERFVKSLPCTEQINAARARYLELRQLAREARYDRSYRAWLLDCALHWRRSVRWWRLRQEFLLQTDL